MRAAWNMKTYRYFKVLKLQHISLIDLRFHFILTCVSLYTVYGNFVLLGNWQKWKFCLVKQN